MDSKLLFGVFINLLFLGCAGYMIAQCRKNPDKQIRSINTWYVFFPDKEKVPDLLHSKKLEAFGKWMKNGSQLYSIGSNSATTKEALEKAIQEEFKDVPFKISNTADLYLASWYMNGVR